MMTHTIRLATLAGLLVGGFCLATLSPAASNEANAQLVIQLGRTSNNVPQAYYHGYGTGYRTGNGYVWQGTRSYGYTGYGIGSYGYGSQIQNGFGYDYGYPSSGYGYGTGSGATHDLYYGGSRSLGRSYYPVYNPNHRRFYSPYGHRGY